MHLTTNFQINRRSRAGLVEWSRVVVKLFLFIAAAMSASAAGKEYLIKNWTTADGIPHNTVRAIVESRNGYLWLGTANGIARFDGVRFKIFDLANTPGLVSDDIYSLYEVRDGTLWLRTRRGLARRTGGRIEFLSLTNSVIPLPFNGLVEDTKGTLWARGFVNIGRWNGRGFTAVPLTNGEPLKINHVSPAREGGLWVASDKGLWRLRDDGPELVVRSPEVSMLTVGPNGEVWGLSEGRKLLAFRDGRWARLAELSGENCTVFYAARNGDVWIGSGSRNAVFRWREGKVTTFSGAEGLEGVRVLDFAQDKDGNVWVGMNAGGLYRLRERRVQLVGREEGFESPNTTTIIDRPDGTMLVGVMGSTLHQVTDVAAVPIQVLSNGEGLGLPTALAPAEAGGVWAGTFAGTLPRVDHGREQERIGSSNGTRTLMVDRQGRLWRGTRTAGVEMFSGTNVTRYTATNGLSFTNVYCLAEDRDGSVWAGTEQGLNRIRDGRITTFNTTNGLGHQFISALCVDSRGTLWAGTLGGGLSAWTGSNFVTLTTREGLVHNAVDQIIEDDLGHLWLGTRLGLMRLSVAQLHEFIGGKVRVVTGTLVGRDEGLLRPNLWTEYQPANAKGRDGRLWFCTGSGVAIIDPRRFENASAAPVIHIEEVTIDGHSRFLEPNEEAVMEIPPESERLEIRYTAISPSEPGQVRFRYQLAGYDRDWIEAGRARVAGYSHLPPGSYQFWVIAVNNDGVWNTTGTSIALEVHPKYWQTTWFRGAMALGFTGLFYLIYRSRIAHLERRRREQEAFSRRLIESQENERKRIAAELHDSLGQNLLVIKNRAALALTQKNSPEKMAEQLAEVSATASAAVREVREISQNLRPFQIDELGITKSVAGTIQRLADASNIQFKTELANIDHLLPPNNEINFYRIIQECLNNIIKHSQAKTVTIQLTLDPKQIQLSIVDNGIGFNRPSNQPGLSGFGLKSITERAHTMGGDAIVRSQPGKGTRIDIFIPRPTR